MIGSISPDEVAKMASAGVLITWADIEYNLKCADGCPSTAPRLSGSRQDMDRRLYERLNYGTMRADGQLGPFEFMAASKLNDTHAVVFIVTREGNDVAIKDELTLFPSDTLITQIRLLEK